MRKLLSANFARLFRNKLFWVCLGGILIYAVLFMIDQGRTVKYIMPDGTFGEKPTTNTLDRAFFFFAMIIGLFGAVFASMYLSVEHGTIRNKISVGCKRSDIYIANFITVFAATVIGLVAWCIGALTGFLVLDPKMDVPVLMQNLLVCVLFIAAFSAIFTLIGTLCANRAAVVVVSILMFFGLLLGGSTIENALMEQEMRPSGISFVTSEANQVSVVDGGMEPNPNYLTGTKRTVYEWMLDILPTGQSLQVAAHGGVNNLTRAALSSVAITLLVTAAGIVFFRRKDLK